MIKQNGDSDLGRNGLYQKKKKGRILIIHIEETKKICVRIDSKGVRLKGTEYNFVSGLIY